MGLRFGPFLGPWKAEGDALEWRQQEGTAGGEHHRRRAQDGNGTQTGAMMTCRGSPAVPAMKNPVMSPPAPKE